MSNKVVKLPKSTKQNAGASGNSLADYVKDRILEAIQGGRYKPGERVLETEVAEWLEVSRTPVREAFRRLESDGLLTFVSWRGVVVSDLDRQQAGELYAMHEVMEGTAARLAARRIDDADFALLEYLLTLADSSEDNAEKLSKINRQFHETIYAAAHNRYLSQMLEQMRNVLALLRSTIAVPGRIKLAAVEHRAILEAIRNRDPEAAETAARAHIAAVQRAHLHLLIDSEKSLSLHEEFP